MLLFSVFEAPLSNGHRYPAPAKQCCYSFIHHHRITNARLSILNDKKRAFFYLSCKHDVPSLSQLVAGLQYGNACCSVLKCGCASSCRVGAVLLRVTANLNLRQATASGVASASCLSSLIAF